MQALRKVVAPRGVLRAVTSSFNKAAVVAPLNVRFQSTLIDAKEKGDENRYFRAQEEARKAELRANLEKVLAMNDSDPEKQEIIEHLCEL